MHHAIGAFLIPPCSVVIPLRTFHQFTERLRVALLEQIAGLLPPEDVIGRIAPGRALVLPPPHQEIQEQRRLIELPALLRAPQNTGKQFPRALSLQKMLLVRRLLIAVPRRNHHAFDAEIRHRIEKLPHALRIGIIEEGRIGRDPVPPLQRRFDRLHRHVIDTVPADRQIMFVFQSVHVDAEREKR